MPTIVQINGSFSKVLLLLLLEGLNHVNKEAIFFCTKKIRQNHVSQIYRSRKITN